MKLRLKALMLALGLTVSAISMSVAAEEETDAAQTVTEGVEESVDEEADTEDETTDSDDSAEAESEDTSESAEMESAESGTEAETESETEAATMSAEEYYKELIANYLTQVDAWTDDQVDSYMESDDAVTALIAYNWNTVKAEVGSFVEVTEITGAETTSDGYGGAISADVEYEGVGNGGTVTVTLEYEYVYSSTYSQYVMSLTNLTWEVDYTLGVMMQKAAMNTVMGICIVFLMLAFLSFLISKIHYIPEAIESRKKNQEPAAPAPAPKPVVTPAAPVVEEEVSLTDDLELVAVITAAIAAAREEDTTVNTGDAYVVRSIKKINNRNWRRA